MSFIKPFKDIWHTSQFKDNIWHRPQLGPPLPPLDPFIITATVDENGLMTVEFAPPPNSSSYRLFIDGSYISLSSGSPITYQYTENGEYSVMVRAYGSGYKYSQSNTVVLTVSGLGRFLYSGLRFIINGLKRILISK